MSSCLVLAGEVLRESQALQMLAQSGDWSQVRERQPNHDRAIREIFLAKDNADPKLIAVLRELLASQLALEELAKTELGRDRNELARLRHRSRATNAYQAQQSSSLSA